MGASGPKLISPTAALSTDTEPTEHGGVDGYIRNLPENCKSSVLLEWGILDHHMALLSLWNMIAMRMLDPLFLYPVKMSFIQLISSELCHY